MTNDARTSAAGRRTWRDRLTTPLTPSERRHVRVQLALIPVYAWLLFVSIAYAIDISPAGRFDRSGHVKGHDFVHFYVIGEIGRDRATGELYDFDAQAARTDRLVPKYEDRFLPVHGPQVAMFFAPFARLPYETALFLWLALSALVYAACCRALWTSLPRLPVSGWQVAILAAAFPPFYSLIAAGQTSAFALAWFTLGFLAMKQRRPWLGGLALGALAYKPPLGMLIPFALLAARQFRAAIAAALAVALEFAAAYLWFGPDAMTGYIKNLENVQRLGAFLDAQPRLMHSLRAFFMLLLPSSPVAATTGYAIAAAIVLVMIVRIWRSGASLELKFAALLVATTLVDPHLYAYDLVILIPAFFLIAAHAVGRPDDARGLWALLYLPYVLPAFDSFAQLIRIQPSVLALFALLVWIFREARRTLSHHVS